MYSVCMLFISLECVCMLFISDIRVLRRSEKSTSIFPNSPCYYNYSCPIQKYSHNPSKNQSPVIANTSAITITKNPQRISIAEKESRLDQLTRKASKSGKTMQLKDITRRHVQGQTILVYSKNPYLGFGIPTL